MFDKSNLLEQASSHSRRIAEIYIACQMAKGRKYAMSFMWSIVSHSPQSDPGGWLDRAIVGFIYVCGWSPVVAFYISYHFVGAVIRIEYFLHGCE